MPSVYSETRHPTIQPSPIPQPDFAFPTNKHLLITTPSRILSWDASGIQEIFKSSKSGIAAATESKDGSGILAVADRHVVILHNTQHGKEKRWGLSAPEDEVRHLEYTKDSRSLFLTTHATNAIQCYSTHAQQLLSPPQTLATPAVALAISATGHLTISAQGSPPVVFLKDLTKNSAATLVKPQASTSGITVAAFHPERANIFLLAFDDGTLAVFDASLLKRGNAQGKYNDQSHAGKAEIGRKKQLHRPMHFKNEGRSRAISGAAFVPGNKLKTVTVGIDGRCKLLDFSDGANVLRTWHCEAPLTCVSVSGSPPAGRGMSTTRKDISLVQPGFSGHLIAVGGQDGSVRLYDLLGLLQGRKELGMNGERIISVEWVEGASPKEIPNRVDVDERAVALQPSITECLAEATQGSIHESTPKHLSVHPALRPSTTNPIGSTSVQTRRFTVHPDEAMGDSTVRHTSSTQSKYMVSAEAGEYLDLFSPVNPFIAEKTRANRVQSFSPTRIRPRISSQTFAQDLSKSKPESAKKVFAQMPVMDPAVDSHTTSSGAVHTSTKRDLALRPVHSTARGSPLKAERRRLNPASVRKRPRYQTNNTETVDATVVANAKLLRELRQMGARTSSIHASGKMKGKESKGVDSTKGSTELFQPQPVSQTQGNVQVYGSGGRWPTDSIDEPSWSEEQLDDIWITSDEDCNKSSRRVYGIERPAARQTSRSQMGSNGTESTKQAPLRSPAAIPQVSGLKTTGPAISADDYTTAQSHMSPDGVFSLASGDVQSLFPRTSSKSPRKGGVGSSKARESPKRYKTALQEIASNAAVSRRTSNPWAKVKQLRGLSTIDPIVVVAASEDRVDTEPAVRPHAPREACSGCAANASKVRCLESEVSHMKGEILALRAMLRRHGIPAPAVPRR